jgi:hypothetical protein
MPPIPDILLFALVPLLAFATAVFFATQRPQDRAAAPTGLAVGASISATLAAVMLVFLPGEAYFLGLKGIVPATLIWLLVPLLAWNILPGIVGPTISSPLAYLEGRFGQRTSLAAGLVYLPGRLLLSSLVLAALARMLSLALGGLPAMLVAFAIGVFGTVCGACCGKRGGVWLGVMMAAALGIGVPFAIATVIKQDGGADRIWEIGQAAQRTWIGDPRLDSSDPGITWNLLPAVWAGLLVFLLGDEATASRLAQLRSADAVRTALVMFLAAVTFFSMAWMYAGLGMFIFYREHPHEVRTQWVVNVEPETRLSRTDPETQSPILDPATGRPKRSLLSNGIQYDAATGTPMLTWDEADVEPADLNELIAQQRLYGRNGQPVRSASEVLDETGERIDPARLAIHSLATNERPSEMLLHRRATEELWSYFVATQAPIGMRGLLLGGLLAAAIAAVDMTGLTGIPSLQRLFPSRSVGAQRTLAAVASLSVTVLGTLWVFVVPFPAEAILYVLASSLAPLAALVMLGLTSRRATPAVAVSTLAVGVAAGVLISLGLNSDPRARIHPLWSVTSSVVGTFLMGHMLALVFGESRRRGQLQGLVLGPVPIGALRDEEDAALKILPEDSEPAER